MEIQKEIKNRCDARITFDTQWDEQHLREEGILTCEKKESYD